MDSEDKIADNNFYLCFPIFTHFLHMAYNIEIYIYIYIYVTVEGVLLFTFTTTFIQAGQGLYTRF